MIRIKNEENILRVLDTLPKERTTQAVKDITEDLYENVKKLARPHFRQRSTLETNIRHKVKSNAGIVWIDNDGMLVNWRGRRLNYVEFVLYGTRPHIIKPRRKKALRFVKLGDFVFAKRVRHPGYRGDNFLQKAINETLNNLERIVR